MSFIVKDIDMPKEPHNIELNEKGIICVQGKEAIMIFKNAEIIEIPTPHGRLIDADALETVFKDMAKCEWNQKAFPISWAYAFEDTIDEIHNAPTILESEGSNESDAKRD